MMNNGNWPQVRSWYLLYVRRHFRHFFTLTLPLCSFPFTRSSMSELSLRWASCMCSYTMSEMKLNSCTLSESADWNWLLDCQLASWQPLIWLCSSVGWLTAPPVQTLWVIQAYFNVIRCCCSRLWLKQLSYTVFLFVIDALFTFVIPFMSALASSGVVNLKQWY